MGRRAFFVILILAISIGVASVAYRMVRETEPTVECAQEQSGGFASICGLAVRIVQGGRDEFLGYEPIEGSLALAALHVALETMGFDEYQGSEALKIFDGLQELPSTQYAYTDSDGRFSFSVLSGAHIVCVAYKYPYPGDQDWQFHTCETAAAELDHPVKLLVTFTPPVRRCDISNQD